jgi:multidrug efflux system membrane fusion protein
MKQVFGLGCWVLGMVGCAREATYEKPLTPVSVQVVELSRGEGIRRYSGNVAPRARVDLAFKVGGYVEEARKDEGDAVRKGEMLARLRDTDYLVKRDQARAQLAQAEAAVGQARSQAAEAEAARAKAEADFRRASRLYESQSLTRPDYDAVKAQFDMAEARVAAARTLGPQAQARLDGARALLREAENALADAALAAPLDGVVVKRLIEPGSLVGPGSGAFVLADTGSVKVVFGAPDVLLPALRIGIPLRITTEALPGVDFPGRITQISPAADVRSRVFDTEVTVPNGHGRLKIGMVAAVETPQRQLAQPAPMTPLAAIVRSQEDPDRFAVFVVEQQGGHTVARARNVKLGETFGNRVAIPEGLRAGERVIISGTAMVRDGERVQIVGGGGS